MITDKFIRIRLSTFRRMHQKFPSFRGETIVDYFERLSKALKEKDAEQLK